ncbi:hypothetical protein KI387_003072, partial [Taxus chinensis]
PYQGDFPEVIEDYLEKGMARCIAFNRRGTLLVAGCTDGACIIWDFETRGVSKELRDDDCTASITSVCWSKSGYQILTSSVDKYLTLWNVVEGIKLTRVMLQQTALYARLHPGLVNKFVGLACPMSCAPILVDFDTGIQQVLPVSALSAGTEPVHFSRGKYPDGSVAFSSATASFNKRGDLIYVGNSKGEILIIDTKTRIIKAVFQVPGGALIRQIVFSKCGNYLLTNSGDRTIRVFENCLPPDDAASSLEELIKRSGDSAVTEITKWAGSQCLTLSKEFQDAVNRLPWKVACFSGDSEWVVGAPGSKGEHKICIWNRQGKLVKILEGPKDSLTDLSWHPVRPLVVSVSLSGGAVYIWAKDYTENWSAFAPDFKELEENEEYVEREDEFDMMPDTEKVKTAHVDEDQEVDIMTTQNYLNYSDSDDSREGLYYLPTVPLPDSPKQQDHSSGSPSKPENSTPSQSDRSPITDEGKDKTPEQSGCQSPDSLVDEPSLNGRARRRRKLSEKGAEMQAEMGRKTFQKHGPSTKRKTGVKTSMGIATNFSLIEGGLLDKEDGLGEFGDEVPGTSQKTGKKRLKTGRQMSYYEPPGTPTDEANGFQNERYF